MEPTADPYVQIEERSDGYVRYRNTETGARWEVHGTCDRRGDCLIGAVIDGVQVRSKRHLARLVKEKGRDRIDSELDVPVTPDFDTCCGADLFTYVRLEPVDGDD